MFGRAGPQTARWPLRRRRHKSLLRSLAGGVMVLTLLATVLVGHQAVVAKWQRDTAYSSPRSAGLGDWRHNSPPASVDKHVSVSPPTDALRHTPQAGRQLWDAGLEAAEAAADAAPGGPLHAARRLAATVTQLESATSILAIATFLVLFGILFDAGKESLFERTGRNAKPVLVSLFGELTLLGFIGLIMFAVERGRLLDGLSRHLFDGDGDTLSSMVETVHMALFLIMVLFLLESLIFLQVAKRLTKQWHRDEVEALFPRNVVNNFVSETQRRRHFGRCKRFWSWACGRDVETDQHRQMVHCSMRRAFLAAAGAHFDDDDDTHGDDKALLAAARKGDALRLTRTNSKEYRKKLQIYAFEVDCPIKVEKSWGLSQGVANDWIICGNNGDVYMNTAKEFMENYEPVGPSQPNVFRKKTTVLAKQMPIPFGARKLDGASVNGKAGHYLVQAFPPAPKHKSGLSTPTGVGEQYAVDPKVFEEQYEPLDKADDDEDDGQRMQHVDFNLALYFSIIMGRFLGEVVEIQVVTWVAVEVFLLAFYALVLLVPRTVFSVILVLAGFCLTTLLQVTLHKLRGIQDDLMDQTLWMKADLRAKALIKDSLMSSSLPASDSNAVAVDFAELETPLMEAAATLPPPQERQPRYTSHPLRPRSACGRRCLGRPGNRHENLFWFDRHGPELVEELVRTTMLLLAVYIAVSAILVYDYECQDGVWWHCAVWYLVAAIPVVVQLSILPRVIRVFVVVSSVEMLKNRAVMSEVVRSERARKSLQALRLISAMKSKVHRLEGRGSVKGHSPRKAPRPGGGAGAGAGASALVGSRSARRRTGGMLAMGGIAEHKTWEGDSDDESKGAALQGPGAPGLLRRPKQSLRRTSTSVYGHTHEAKYMRRRAQLQEAFNMFDRDNSGEVNSSEMAGVLEMIGFKSESKEMARRIVDEIDCDDSGSISFEEFFEWIAHVDLHSAKDSEELDEQIFDMIDTDDSGEITVDELRKALLSMGEVMSYDDVVHLIREADGDGDGSIDKEEFIKMMKRHTRYEDHL